MDHVLQETERNRQMANQIAHATFTTYGGVLPTGPKVKILQDVEQPLKKAGIVLMVRHYLRVVSIRQALMNNGN